MTMQDMGSAGYSSSQVVALVYCCVKVWGVGVQVHKGVKAVGIMAALLSKIIGLGDI